MKSGGIRMSLKPTSEQKLLEVKNIVAHYGKALALNDVSFSIPAGVIAAFIGANGAGKSTLLRVITGLVKATSGEVWYQGVRVDKVPTHTIIEHGIAHAPEGRGIFAKMSVLDNLKMGGYTQRDKEKMAECMERAFRHFPVLKERSSQRAGTLSGGELQMLAISRGLMSNPKLLLLDEPSLGLSPLMTEEIGRVVKDINSEGTTIILVEQNARLAFRLSQRAYVLEVGKLVLEGDTSELIKDENVVKAYFGV